MREASIAARRGVGFLLVVGATSRQRAGGAGETVDGVSLRFYAELSVGLPIHRDETSLDARAIELDAVQPGAPLAMALIIQPVVLDLQAGSQEAGAEDPHRDRQILPMATRTRRDILGAVISAVGACRGVPRAFDRLHQFPADAQRLQQLRRLKADVEPVGRLAAQLHRLQLPEPGGRFHLAENRTGARFPPEGQGHAKMSIGPHLAAAQMPHNNRPQLPVEPWRFAKRRTKKNIARSPRYAPQPRGVTAAVPRDTVSCPTHRYVLLRRAARRGGGATCAAGVATLTDPPNDALTFATADQLGGDFPPFSRHRRVSSSGDPREPDVKLLS